jgi:hypothetical protein
MLPVPVLKAPVPVIAKSPDACAYPVIPDRAPELITKPLIVLPAVGAAMAVLNVFAPAKVCVPIVTTPRLLELASGMFNVIVPPKLTGEALKLTSLPEVPVANVIDPIDAAVAFTQLEPLYRNRSPDAGVGDIDKAVVCSLFTVVAPNVPVISPPTDRAVGAIVFITPAFDIITLSVAAAV